MFPNLYKPIANPTPFNARKTNFALYFIFADGACKYVNEEGKEPAAGYACKSFSWNKKELLLRNTHSFMGRVETDPLSPRFMNTIKQSNNTGELSAIGTILDLLLKPKYEIAKADWYINKGPITICSDSHYALNMLKGTWKPKTITHFIKLLVMMKEQLTQEIGFDISFIHVSEHCTNLGNIATDELASASLRFQT